MVYIDLKKEFSKEEKLSKKCLNYVEYPQQ